MSIKAAIYHLTHYTYDRPVVLAPQIIRLQPAPQSRTKVLSHSLRVSPAKHFVNLQQDPYGNYLSRHVFTEPVTELKIEVTQTKYSTFRVVIDRVNHGRVAILDNMLKDSNGHVRLQLNPAAFGAGDYLLTLEGLNMRREGTPAAWVRLNVGR